MSILITEPIYAGRRYHAHPFGRHLPQVAAPRRSSGPPHRHRCPRMPTSHYSREYDPLIRNDAGSRGTTVQTVHRWCHDCVACAHDEELAGCSGRRSGAYANRSRSSSADQTIGSVMVKHISDDQHTCDVRYHRQGIPSTDPLFWDPA